ncbi:hypothetical protein D3C71_656790 [compost metagenome]
MLKSDLGNTPKRLTPVFNTKLPAPPLIACGEVINTTGFAKLKLLPAPYIALLTFVVPSL